jgi:hypothetical protein
MEITDKDRLFYSNAMEVLTQRFEIAREFVRHNGLPSLPMEELTTLMIVGIKEWLTGTQGEQWLSTMGYVRHDHVTFPGNITMSGTVSLSGTMCPVCSGFFSDIHGMHCECCGKLICNPCASIVDPVYQIGWCSDCLSKQPLTNLLVYNE